MAKYIDVKITLEKTMKVDNDNLEEALEIARNEYPDLELTPEWLDARNVELKENVVIRTSAERLADLYHAEFNREDIEDTLDILFGKSEIRDYIYNETIDILKNKYHLEKIDIKIQEDFIQNLKK